MSSVSTREEFVKFVNSLALDLEINPEDWENRSLGDFLSSLASWVEDMEGYYENMELPQPPNVSWQFFAEVLMAAKVYE
jgi:hypothetical protein